MIRRGLNLCFWIAVLGCCTLCANAQSAPKDYVLQFKEDFSGGAVDISKWTYRTDTKALSAELAANVSVADGRLIITPKQERFGGMDFTGGGILSKAAFRYGYYSVDAKTYPTPGWHSSFWAMAGDGSTTHPDVARTEIDDFEIDSVSPEKVSMGLLVWEGAKNIESVRCNADYRPGYSTAAGMHNYAFEWTEDAITYFLDGKRICSQPYPPTAGTHDLVHIWLTALGYKQPIQADGHSTVEFAHVRYYIRDYYIGVKETGYAEYGKGWADGKTGGYSNLGTRSSCSEDARAVWTPTILAAGNYDVELWRSGDFGSSPGLIAKATISSHSGRTEKDLHVSAGNTGWADLGVFEFDPGSTGSLQLQMKNGGCLSASMVKFVRK